MQKIEIQIIGFGCPQCKNLVRNAKQAADDLGIECEVRMFLDSEDMTRFGSAMVYPALVINGKVKVTGEVVSVEEIKGLLLDTLDIGA